MTDDETHRPAPPRPVTYHDAEDRYGPGAYKARERFDELAGRDVQARAIAALKARGEFDPGRHSDPAKYPPLALEERLELLALGEIIALHYRHPVQVHHALEAGAAWTQIAAARNTDEATARRDYRTWADGQHHLWLYYQGKFGMNEAEHAAAIERAGLGQEAPAADGLVKLPPGGVVLTTAPAAAVTAALESTTMYLRERAASCGDCQASPADLCEACACRLDRAGDDERLAGLLAGRASPAATEQEHESPEGLGSGEIAGHARLVQTSPPGGMPHSGPPDKPADHDDAWDGRQAISNAEPGL